MSVIKKRDLLIFEKLFKMETGYVIHFSNRTFENFFYETINKNIYSDEYALYGSSKANRLRCFIEKEDNFSVAKILEELLQELIALNERIDKEMDLSEEQLIESARRIIDNLKAGTFSESLSDINESIIEDTNFERLKESIRMEIESNNPENALDRIHTFMTRYIRSLCSKHKIEFHKNEPLNSLFGKYRNYLSTNNLLETRMTSRILKSTGDILESFNSVRNDKSLAHDNDVLNYSESMFIFKNASSTIAFIKQLEDTIDSLIVK